MRFLHAADIHLDSPMRGLPAYDGAPSDQIRLATRGALQNMVDLAIERAVNFVLIAGDTYDGDWRDHTTGLCFFRQMAALEAASIPVFIIQGNHDAQSLISKKLKLPANVHTFSTKKPETVTIPELNVALHGQGFKTQHVTDNMALHYPEPRPGMINIGLLHTSADGRDGHANYAPCSIPDLIAKGYDYWALGHIHKRELLHQDPPILFPGNLQGRHINEEADEGKGCTLVEITDHGTVSLEHVTLDRVRWCRIAVDIEAEDGEFEIIERCGRAMEQALASIDGRVLAARIILRGRTPLHGQLIADPAHMLNQIRAETFRIRGEPILIEKLECRTQAPADRSMLLGRTDPVGAVANILAQGTFDAETRAELEKTLKPFLDKLRTNTRGFDDTTAATLDDDGFAKLAAEAAELALSRLVDDGQNA